MVNEQKIRSKELIGYFSYAVGQCLSFGLVGSFLLYFYTDILGISAGFAAVIFLTARVWDAVNDPIIAGFMDTLAFKRGKFIPYLRLAPLFIALTTSLSFIAPDLSPGTKAAYAAITYLAWGMIYTISDVPFWAMSSVMSRDPQERAKAVTTAMLGVNIGIAGASVVFPRLSSFFADVGTTNGYTEGVIALMAAALVLMGLGARAMRERIPPDPDHAMTLADSFRAVRRNKPLAFVLAAFFCNVFFNLSTGLYIYFFTYNMGDAGLVAAMGSLSLAASMTCLLMPLLTRRHRKRDLFIILSALEIVLRIGFYAAGHQNLVAVLTFLTLIHAVNVMTNPMISAMISETVEYAELETGRRCAAIAFSGQTFTGKLAWAVSGGMSGSVLLFLGYRPAAAQSQETLDGLFVCVALLPVLGALLRILIMSFYRFTEEKHAEARAQLEKAKSAPQTQDRGGSGTPRVPGGLP